jgi:hypothetical protein
MVVPVSTKSTTASASPKPQAASTLPDTYLMLVGIPLVSNCLKNVLARLGNDVTIRFPAKLVTSLILDATGAWTQRLHPPNPKFWNPQQ